MLLPELSYKSLNVQNGTMAMVGWEKSLDKDLDDHKKDEIRNDLLEYCKLDTLAMVEIWKLLSNIK